MQPRKESLDLTAPAITAHPAPVVKNKGPDDATMGGGSPESFRGRASRRWRDGPLSKALSAMVHYSKIATPIRCSYKNPRRRILSTIRSN